MTMTEATETIVMTGATRGIGLEAAKALLHREPRAHLVVLARAASAARVIPDLLTVSPHISTVDVDLASTKSVNAAAQQVEDRLDAGDLPALSRVVCNAGVHLDSALHATVDGYERTFAVNVLATHLLLRRLHPHLRSPARIVVTVSDAHFGDLRHTGGTFPRTAWSSPEILFRPGAYRRSRTVRAGRRAYATSKLGGIYLVHEWARRLPDGIDIVAYNPSLVVGTGLASEAGGASDFLMRNVVPLLTATPLVDKRSVAGAKLADTISGVTKAPSGAYIHRTRTLSSSNDSYDSAREAELWAWLENVADHDPVPPSR